MNFNLYTNKTVVKRHLKDRFLMGLLDEMSGLIRCNDNIEWECGIKEADRWMTTIAVSGIIICS